MLEHVHDKDRAEQCEDIGDERCVKVYLTVISAQASSSNL